MTKTENQAGESKKALQLTIQVLEDRNSLPLSFDDIELSACSSSSSSSDPALGGACSCSSCC